MRVNKAIDEKLANFCDEVEKMAPSPFDPRLAKYTGFAGHVRSEYTGTGQRFPSGIKKEIRLLSAQAKAEFCPRQMK